MMTLDLRTQSICFGYQCDTKQELGKPCWCDNAIIYKRRIELKLNYGYVISEGEYEVPFPTEMEITYG